MSNTYHQDKYARKAKQMADVQKLLKRLGVAYSLHNNDTHIIINFDHAKMHIWASSMKWRVNEGQGKEGAVKQGNLQQLEKAILAARSTPAPVYPTKTPEELHEVKANWLVNGGTPPQMVAGFENYKEELIAFYRRTQEVIQQQVDTEVKKKYDDYFKAKECEFHQLGIHQSMKLTDNVEVMRVHGGWIYKQREETTSGDFGEETTRVAITSTFVPSESGVVYIED